MPLSAIEPFLPGTVPFSQHLEQLDWIFVHHKITDPEEKKVSFLASCNTEVYTELKMLFPDRNLKVISFQEICNALCKRYDKSESILRRRYKFYRREQGPSEGAEDFIRAVKQLAERCDFGGFKSEAIRDKLVLGVGDRDLQKRLLDMGDLTLREAEQCLLFEDLQGSRFSSVSGGESNRDLDSVRSYTRHSVGKDLVYETRSGRSNRARSRSRSRSFNRRINETTSQRKAIFHCSFCNKDGHVRRYCYRLKDNIRNGTISEPKRRLSDEILASV